MFLHFLLYVIFYKQELFKVARLREELDMIGNGKKVSYGKSVTSTAWKQHIEFYTTLDFSN